MQIEKVLVYYDGAEREFHGPELDMPVENPSDEAILKGVAQALGLSNLNGFVVEPSESERASGINLPHMVINVRPHETFAGCNEGSCEPLTTPPVADPNEEGNKLKLTEVAATEIKKVIEDQKLDQSKTFLRMAVKAGGCSGFQYQLDIVEGKSEEDHSFESHGVQIVCDPKSFSYIKGTTLDFRTELSGRGFVFDNPNKTGGCGCGKSFS